MDGRNRQAATCHWLVVNSLAEQKHSVRSWERKHGINTNIMNNTMNDDKSLLEQMPLLWKVQDETLLIYFEMTL